MEYSKKELDRIQRIINYDLQRVLGFPLENIFNEVQTLINLPQYKLLLDDMILDDLDVAARQVHAIHKHGFTFDPKKHESPLKMYEYITLNKNELLDELIEPFDVEFVDHPLKYTLCIKLQSMFEVLIDRLWYIGAQHNFEDDIDQYGEVTTDEST